MVFLIDIPSDYTKNKASGSDLKIYLTKAHEIFNFLYDLGSSKTEPENTRFLKLRKLIILNADKNLNLKEFTRVLVNYSPDPRTYGTDLEEDSIIQFPSPDKLVDKSIRGKILNILSSAEVLEYSGANSQKTTEIITNKNSEILLYLPILNFASDIIPNLVLQKAAVYLYSDASVMKSRSFSGLKEIKSDMYLEIHSKLAEARKRYGEMDPDLFEARNQIPPETMEAIGGNLFNTLKRIKEKDIKHIIIQGQDEFLINQVVNFLIADEMPLYYDMNRAVPYFDKQISSPIVLLNIERLQDNQNKKKLFEVIKLIDKAGQRVILQCKESSWKKEFYGYEEILLPDIKDIQSKIADIFNALLVYNKLFKGFIYKLYLLGKSQCLSGLLPDVKSVEALNHIVKRLSEVSESDMLNNISFWCNIHIEAKSIVSETASPATEQMDDIISETISFDLVGNDWIVSMPRCAPFAVPYNSFIGLKYIIVILQNYNYSSEKELHIEHLREVVIKYAEKFNKIRNKDSMTDIEDIRKNIQDAIGSLKAEYAHLRQFCDEHIEYAKEYYSFRPKGKQSGKIAKCEIYDPNWKNNLLNK